MGDLRTALSLGQVKPSDQALGSPRPWLGGCLGVPYGYFLALFLRAADPLGQKEPLFGGGPGKEEKG